MAKGISKRTVGGFAEREEGGGRLAGIVELLREASRELGGWYRPMLKPCMTS